MVAQIKDFLNLSPGWDGERSAAPSKGSANNAIRFLRSVGSLAHRLEPTIHSDGSILFEMEGGEGSLRFNDNNSISYAISGHPPATVELKGVIVPEGLRKALAI